MNLKTIILLMLSLTSYKLFAKQITNEEFIQQLTSQPTPRRNALQAFLATTPQEVQAAYTNLNRINQEATILASQALAAEAAFEAAPTEEQKTKLKSRIEETFQRLTSVQRERQAAEALLNTLCARHHINLQTLTIELE